jgi:hypothetical protein
MQLGFIDDDQCIANVEGVYTQQVQSENAPDPLGDQCFNHVISLTNEWSVGNSLGLAAYVSDLLAEVTSSARPNDFLGVERVKPVMDEFSPEECLILESFDREAPLA